MNEETPLKEPRFVESMSHAREDLKRSCDPKNLRMARVLCSGSFMCDFIATDLPRIGEPGDLVYAPNGIDLHSGGHAANVAIDLTQLGQQDVAVTGCIGDDFLGGFMENELKKHGLIAYPERLGGVPTSKNLVLVVRGEDRRFYAELAANTMLSPVHVLSILDSTRPDIFYQGTVGGLKVLDGHVESVLGEARRLGCLTVLDVVRPSEGGWRKLEESLPLIDVFHCNELESTALTGEEDPGAAANALIDAGVNLCLITKGADGLVATLGETMLKAPSFSVRTVDPTGAGDAFCAGVIDALLRADISQDGVSSISPENFKRILLRGAAAGAACVTASGATVAVTWESVDRLIREQGNSVWERTERL